MRQVFLTTDFTDVTDWPDSEIRVIREIRGFLPPFSKGLNRHG